MTASVFFAMCVALALLLLVGGAYLVVRVARSGQPTSLVIMFSVVFVMVLAVVGWVAGNVIDEARLDRQFEPLLVRDYPGWGHEVFTYSNSKTSGGHGRGYLLANSRYPGLRISVDYRLKAGLVRGALPYLEPVDSGVYCDDGYFRRAGDIVGFQMEWDQFKPDGRSIVASMFLDGSRDGVESWTVYSTGGQNGREYDDPTLDWVSIFTRDTATGEWHGSPFKRLSE